MLQLKNIVKTYKAGDTEVHALRGIDLSFRENELVAILGPSGCGKTTLLNIIGGLDNYDSGDLIINGVSTKKYRDSDWDAYRNHSIGFIFQSYNLIPHQSVLSNVELALTLSGVSRAERRKRATAALESVGLGDQLKKRPNQMSGGQMQRVAVARALVNNPDILLADEPTGALDSETSVQLMEILKEISKTKLVIMVTHNPELAEKYATRTVRVLDGRVIDDSDPFSPVESASDKRPTRQKKPSMSIFTAMSLSLNNLMTKKGRTFLTAFAGSIGIIGIALILSLSNGVQQYIDRVQEDTLSSYPISIEAKSVDMGSLLSSIMGIHQESEAKKSDEELGDNIYSNAVMYDLINAMTTTKITENDLARFKKFLETPGPDGKLPLEGLATSIRYDYQTDIAVYITDQDGKVMRSDPNLLLSELMKTIYGGSAGMMSGMGGSQSFKIWEELLSTESGDDLVSPLLYEQYDVISGRWPESYDEVVLVVDKNNTVSDLVLYSLGLLSSDEIIESFKSSASGEEHKTEQKSWSFDDICGMKLKYIPECDRYALSTSGAYNDLTTSDAGLSYLYDKASELTIVGIIRGSDDAVATMMSGSIGYTSALTRHLIDYTANSDIVKAQLADPDTDVILGIPFKSDETVDPTTAEMAEAVRAYLASADNATKAEVYVSLKSIPSDEMIAGMVEQAMGELTRPMIEKMITDAYLAQMQTDDVDAISGYISSMDDETLFSFARQMLRESVVQNYTESVRTQLSALSADQLAAMYDAENFSDELLAPLYEELLPAVYSDSTYDENLDLLGYIDIDSPKSMSIYAATFADKEKIADVIRDYNDGVDEDHKISYVDYVALMMSSITTIINAISYVLMAFVSISLVVSSIMIGIITYISVLERTKEIGILRSIGASKRDIKRVFNAETLIIGFTSGAIGIIVTVLLCIPINIIIRALTDIQILGASLPPVAGAVLVAISMILTLISGLIPSSVAAKKDPVIALRTE